MLPKGVHGSHRGILDFLGWVPMLPNKSRGALRGVPGAKVAKWGPGVTRSRPEVSKWGPGFG